MIGKIFAALALCAFVCGAATGHIEAVGKAAVDGAGQAVQLTLGLMGMMILWSGILGILERAGALRRLSALLSPLIRFLFPSCRKSDVAREAIAANVSANFLGLGNAATPSGITAMQKLSNGNEATPDAIMLAVLNTVPFQLLPTTLFALRSMAGSAQPYIILVPVWFCSLITLCGAVTLNKILSRLFFRRKKE